MTTKRFVRARVQVWRAGAAALIATQVTCALFDGKCTFETRDLHAAGEANEAGALLAAASVTVSETRGSLTQGEMHGIVTGSSLSGHVLSAVIKDVAGSVPAVPLTIRTVASDVLAEGGADKTTVNLAAFHNLIAADRGLVELTTDVASHPTISILLVPTQSTGWNRPNCS